MENEYGRIIAYERKRTKLSAEQICEGICDRIYLQRIEKGERSCEKILADALLQRMGVSAQKFSYILNVQELNLILWKEQIVDFVNKNQIEEAYCKIEDYREKTKKKSKLYLQFCMLAEAVLEWQNGCDIGTIRKKILDAWDITRKGKSILKLRGQRFSYFELSFSMLYVRLMEESGEEKEASKGYQELLLYLEKRVEEDDRVKWYSQIAYRLVCLLKKANQQEQALAINQQAIQLLQKYGSTFYLTEHLGVYLELQQEKMAENTESITPDIRKRVSDICEIRKALQWCEQNYKRKQVTWFWDISFDINELYLCQEIIRGRRIGLGMTQEELAKGICDPVTISRIENGISYPKRHILVPLLEKVVWSGENCTLTAQIGNPEYHQTTSRISNMTSLGKHKEAEILLLELDEKIQEKNLFAKQYFQNNLGAVQFALEKKNAQELYAWAEEALHLTMPKLDKTKLEKWHFSRAEVMCINVMSYVCEHVGKAEYVIELLKIVKRFYERQNLDLRHYQIGYKLTLRNLGSLLGNIGEYQESILLADKSIELSIHSEEIATLPAALYDRGWDMEHLWKNGTFSKKESLSYIKASYYIDLFLGKTKQYEFDREHIKKFYGEEV